MSGMQVAPYQEFAREKLGFEFEKIDLLITALTHVQIPDTALPAFHT
jgi:hypothetical protein